MSGVSRKAKTSSSLPMAGASSPNTVDVSVELDTLLVGVLRTRIVAEVEKRMGLDVLTGQVGRVVT
jgi:hypothetical protein